MSRLIVIACFVLCGCEQSETEKAIRSEGPVPFTKGTFQDPNIQIAMLNELREIKLELRKMNAAKEGGRK